MVYYFVNKSQPAKDITLNRVDWAIDIAAWVYMLLSLIFLCYSYQVLPDVIPIHFNIYGDIDGHGKKQLMLTHPAVSLLLLIGLTILSRYPHKYNYPVQITAANIDFQYRNAKRMISVCKILIVNGHVCSTVLLYLAAKGMVTSVGIIPLLVFMPYLSLIYFFVKAKRGY